MALANENAIYSQLTAAPTFQPSVATLFSDWAVEPGDIVMVQSEGQTYNVPVYSSTLTWKGGFEGDGTSLLEIQSTGNQTRAPLPALKRREYAAGAGGHGAAKEQEEKFKQYERAVVDTDELLGLYAYEFKEDKTAQEGRMLVAETAIEQTAREILLRARTSYMEARLSVTADAIRAEVEDRYNNLRGYILQTAERLQVEYTRQYEGLRGYLVITADRLETEFTNQYEGLRGYVVQTASYLQAEYTSQYQGLRGYLLLTADRLETEFTNQYQGLRGYVVQTASYLQAEYTSQYTGLRGYVTLTAERLQTEFTSQYEGLRGYVSQTAQQLKSEYTSYYTNSMSMITQTADDVTVLVTKTGINSLSSGETLYGRITAIEGSAIYQARDSITAAVGALNYTETYTADDNGAYYRYWDAASGSYKYALAPSGYTGQRYSADKKLHVIDGVGLVLDKTVGGATASFGVYSSDTLTAGVIVNKINNDSTVTIQASKINLDGYVTATQLNTQKARIDNLVSGATQATKIWTSQLEAGSINVPSAANISINGNAVVTARALSPDGTETIPVYAVSSTHGSSGFSNLGNVIAAFGTPSTSGGQTSIPYTKLNGDTGTLTFSSAASQRSVSGLETITLDSTDTGSNVQKTIDVFYDNDDEGSVTAVINASAVYNAGWGAAQSKVGDSGTSNNDYFYVYVPSSTVGNTASRTYTMSWLGSWRGAEGAKYTYVYVKRGSTTVARFEVDYP